MYDILGYLQQDSRKTCEFAAVGDASRIEAGNLSEDQNKVRFRINELKLLRVLGR